MASTSQPVLLHGDLHHDNILRHYDTWMAIDPKGILGDRHFDGVQYLLNYAGEGQEADARLARRLAIMCEHLTLEADRIARWGVVKGLLDACWALEDHADWRPALATAQRFLRWLQHSVG
jgi:streptomycin 6-kinase